MKKMLIGLLVFGCFSAFAKQVDCKANLIDSEGDMVSGKVKSVSILNDQTVILTLADKSKLYYEVDHLSGEEGEKTLHAKMGQLPYEETPMKQTISVSFLPEDQFEEGVEAIMNFTADLDYYALTNCKESL